MAPATEQKPVILYTPAGLQAEQDCACGEEGIAPIVLHSPSYDQTETDCACPDTGFASSIVRSGEIDATWQLSSTLYHSSLPEAYELVFNPVGPASIVVLNEFAQAILNDFAQPRPLETSVTRQLAALGLLQPYDAAPVKPPVKVQSLTAWLHVTNACNLRCTYCYLAKTEDVMDEATGRAAVEAIFRSAVKHNFLTVKLKYAGGEATLNFPLVRVLHQHSRDLATKLGLVLHEVVLSNGVALSNKMLDFIRETGMRLMISLDGVAAAHDVQRTFANGRGSFALIARSIERAIDRGIQPYLSITVTGHNADRLADAVTFALDRELLFNLNFYRNNDYTRDRKALLAEDERLIAGVRAAFAVIEERLPRQSLIAALVDRANFSSPHHHTCGAGHNYLVVDHYGRIARCQMEIERTVTDIFANDPLLAVQEETIGFQNVSVDEKEGCRECEWRYWCGGGCPLLTYRVIGRSDVKSPYCNVYKALYPELLRLEGLRLLKWGTSHN